MSLVIFVRFSHAFCWHAVMIGTNSFRCVNEIGEEAKDMDGEEPILFCGIERLPIDVGVAVAVGFGCLCGFDPE